MKSASTKAFTISEEERLKAYFLSTSFSSVEAEKGWICVENLSISWTFSPGFPRTSEFDCIFSHMNSSFSLIPFPLLLLLLFFHSVCGRRHAYSSGAVFTIRVQRSKISVPESLIYSAGNLEPISEKSLPTLGMGKDFSLKA